MLLLSLIAGSSAGIQFWLLAGGTLIVFYGTERLPIALAVTCLLVGTFLVIEFWVPGSTTWAPMTPRVADLIKSIAAAGEAFLVAGFVYLAMRMAEKAEAALEFEYARSEALLRSIMPDRIAARLKSEPQAIIADKYDQVTLLFADVVDFTPRASLLTPEELVALLNRIFSSFDALAEKHGLEKIKTIGDAYMVAAGLEGQPDQVAMAADMALDMLDTVRSLSNEIGEELAVRIGIHTGPAVAGVLGKRKLFYDVWGDTVNTAARMEAYGSPDRIQVTEAVYRQLHEMYAFEQREIINIKGKGPMQVYFLLGRSRHRKVTRGGVSHRQRQDRQARGIDHRVPPDGRRLVHPGRHLPMLSQPVDCVICEENPNTACHSTMSGVSGAHVHLGSGNSEGLNASPSGRTGVLPHSVFSMGADFLGSEFSDHGEVSTYCCPSGPHRRATVAGQH